MKNIAEVDKNFKVETNIDKPDIKFYNAESEPFEIYGIFKENGKFRRLPEDIAKAVSDGVHYLHACTAGGRVRFKTDSPYIAISAKMPTCGKMPHFAFTGSAGFDLYVSDEYADTFRPPIDIVDGYEGVVELGAGGIREITINMPLYSEVSDLYIGLSESATVLAPTPYKSEIPLVFYGSSITQGGCASRPGTAYTSIVARHFGYDHINLGFSGNARGEDVIAEYVRDLDMSIFIYDYDHNAPTVAALEATHEKMFKTVRAAHPTLPIIMMTRPKYHLTEEEKLRHAVVKKTYDNAVAAGDKNVYFISGIKLMEEVGAEGTVDNCHPTDLGFYSMAREVIRVIEGILAK